MDAVDFWLLRYESVHSFVADDLVADLTEPQVRGRCPRSTRWRG
jgi:hypothetical protein